MFGEPPRRKKVRLQNRDYSEGAYFVTICTMGGHEILGSIEADVPRLTDIGQILEANWQRLASIKGITIDEFVVMPNHFHGIIAIEAGHALSLPTIIRQFKSRTVKALIRAWKDPECRIWQLGYHETVIIGERHLAQVRKYIRNNPSRWEDDEYYPRKPNNDHT